MLWFGWLGFNGGSAFGANLRAVMSIWNSIIAAACAGITWCLMDYRVGHKFGMVGFCTGTIAGLVAATASCGFIPPWASLIMGVVAGFVCNVGTKRELSVNALAQGILYWIFFSQVLLRYRRRAGSDGPACRWGYYWPLSQWDLRHQRDNFFG
jgi:ammonia channel protein AmtB